MSGLRPPGLGPIVGHTTDKACRLWIRAADPGDQGAELASERRTIGVLAVIQEDDKINSKPPVHYFRLHREFDRTGTFNLGEDITLGGSGRARPLSPDTVYRVRMGTLTVDDPSDNDEMVSDDVLVRRLPPSDDWPAELLAFPPERAEAIFRTFPDEKQVLSKLSFILGSCRYPGMFWKVKRSDRIFGPIQNHVNPTAKGEQAKFVLMVGDQIYADKLNRNIPIGLADTFEEFQDRYHDAFGSRNMRSLLRCVPTYMILDDHEIEDNWTQTRIRKDSAKRKLFNLAINAYMSYQWSHGPRTYPERLYYKFDCGGYPYFILDTRTQRFVDIHQQNLDNNHMLGYPSLDPENEPGQLDRLQNWLDFMQKERGNVPKFIVSSSVFVPNPMSARRNTSTAHKIDSDSWPGFPKTRRALLDCIVAKKIQNVIFLSGDIHCSNLAEMSFRDANGGLLDIKAFSITSSAFYWPFPFADGDPSDYVHDSSAQGQEDTFDLPGDITMDYKAWNFTQEDNYCLLEIDRGKAEITVGAFNSDGHIIQKKLDDGRTRKLEGKLKLTKW